MAVLYVHIGMLKTGTTAIQKFLAANADALAKQGAVFPDFGLRYEWTDKERNAHFLTKEGYEEKTALSCFEKINTLADTFSTIILSDEGLWNKNTGDNVQFWKNLKQHLRPDIQIRLVAYLRRQDAYIYSFWAQEVKAQHKIYYKTYPFAEYISSGTYQANHLDFRDYFRAGICELGRENVLIRVFEKQQFADGSLYADFFQTVGLTLTDEFRMSEQLVNISIRGAVLETKRYLNFIPEFSEKGFRILPYLERVQKKMENEGTLCVRNDFPLSERIAFMRSFDESNEWTARELLGRADGILFYEPLEDGEGAEDAYSTGEITAVCGNIMIEMMKDLNRQKRKVADQKKIIEEQRRETAQLKGRPGVHRAGSGIGPGLKRKMKNLMKH